MNTGFVTVKVFYMVQELFMNSKIEPRCWLLSSIQITYWYTCGSLNAAILRNNLYFLHFDYRYHIHN